MKQVFIILLSVLMIQGCKSGSEYTAKGNGKIVSFELPVKDYSQINMSGVCELIYEQKTNKMPYLKVETDENLKDMIDIKVRNGKLSVRMNGNNVSSTKFKVYTNSTGVNRVSISGTGNLTLKKEISSPRLKASISGAGNLKAEKLRCSDFELSISGVGNADLEGDIYNSEINISGSGNVDAFKLKTKNTSCKISGVGTAKVYASESVYNRVSGKGNIEYKGNPKRKDSKASGMGKIVSK